ncbi:MAG: DUF5692 family protein [Erysipelotrichaceae bacterium]
MGLLFEGVTLASALTLLVFVGVWIFLNEITRRSKVVSLLAYVVLPIVLAVLIFTNVLYSPTGYTWFPWVKVISALLGVYGFMAIRFTKWGQGKFAVIFPVMILAVNIAEAVYRELQVFATYKELTVDAGGVLVLGGGWNILNAIAGVICIVTLCGFAGIKVSNDKTKDMIWPDMTWMYIAGYTLWNFAYVYNCISSRAMYAGFGILLAAVLAEYFFKRGAWLQHRAQILSLYAMFSLSVDFQQWSVFQIVPTYTESVLWGIGVVSFLFNLGVLVYMLYTIKTKKKNPLKEDVYTDTKAYQKNLVANNLV